MLVSAMLSGMTAYVLHVLRSRCVVAEDEIRRTSAGGGASDLARMFNAYCRTAVGAGMLPSARLAGLSGLRVRYRDHADRFNTVADLLEEMHAKATSTSYGDLVKLVKMFYQLEYSLDANPELGHRVLSALERRIQDNDGTRQVGSIERVVRGQRCDTQKMTPVRSGSYVEQPLGFIIYSPEKRVMTRAEVLCR